MSPKDRFQIMLEADQLAQLRQLQEETGAPVAEHIRRAIDAYLVGFNRKKRK